MRETLYLLRSPANAARLAQGIAQLEAGDVVESICSDLRENSDESHVCQGRVRRPRPLDRHRRDTSGYWARRINDEHRLVYAVSEDHIMIAQARYHY